VPAQTTLAPEILVPKLGDYLVERQIILPAQLVEALVLQKRRRESGENALLGDILVEAGVLDRRTLDQAITVQIMQLRNALQESNRSLEQKVALRTQELQIALNKLSELDRMKSNIIASISHELRTPLTHIKGYQELLLAGAMGKLTPTQEETIGIIRNASERLERLIDDLISISQISRGEAGLKISVLDIKSIVTQAFTRNQAAAEKKSIQITSNIADGLPKVKGDTHKLLWVISHLLENAIKFTPNEGRVSLEVWQLDKQVQIAVKDTGIGIPSTKYEEIFEPFHQLDSSASRKYGGTGIGLTLAKQILEAHDATIQVQSQPGAGSTFKITLK
jgi:signal transduction histidine kinase